MSFKPSFLNIQKRLYRALQEDHAFNDLTSRKLPRYDQEVLTANVLAKAPGIFCGVFLLKPIFTLLDKKVIIKTYKKDGDPVKKGDKIASLKGKPKAILAGERLFLNLACHLSGVATLTHQYVKAVENMPVQILDTRKTFPLWRDFEKFAVRCGGGINHRFSLDDAILVKDNHLAYLRKKGIPLTQVFSNKNLNGSKRKIKFVEVEAQTYDEVWEAIKAEVDIIMLDNMSDEKIKNSISFIKAARTALGKQTPLIEVSGGIKIPRAQRLAQWGIDRISVGALTHSAPALDISLEVIDGLF